MKELRKRHGWSAERLAQEMRAVGVPWQRIVVAKLENGRRPFVTIDELLALAQVLDVAPIDLLLPVDQEARYAATPKTSVQSGVARAWIRGQIPLHGQDSRIFYSEGPGAAGPTWSAEEIGAMERLLASARGELERDHG